MAETPQGENLSEQEQNLPSEALYMGFETALLRAKAIFSAISELTTYLDANNNNTINALAGLGEVILEDQLKSIE
jgi:hypothetical protein